jgi:predicted nucleic acid-binding protein
MRLFWDTSAVLPLIFLEPHSSAARGARDVCTEAYGWSWMRIEAEAGLARRRATPEQWTHLALLCGAFIWIDLLPAEYPALLALNRSTALRASDAGHLYSCERLGTLVKALRLITFDEELRVAATHRGVALWTP